jgi:CRISPR-associated protein (TIGR02584 family)
MIVNILIITVGETPQVVTETVYGLLTQPDPWVPDRIVIATTGRGANGFRQGVPPSEDGRSAGRPPLTGAGGRLVVLYSELGKADQHVEPEIAVAHMADGRRIGDIRSDAEVNAFADMLLELVADVTADDTGQLHLSLAGGRKTMSFIAGQVMALHGRAQDVMSHVLVEPIKLESLASFWWPGQRDVVSDRDGSLIDASTAQVVLHAVPYIRLKAFLDAHHVLGPIAPGGYAAAVARANQALSFDRITLDMVRGELRLGAVLVEQTPKAVAVLATIFGARKMGRRIKPVSPNDPDNYRLSLDGIVEDGMALWSWCITAAKIEDIYDGNASMATHTGLLDDARGKAERQYTHKTDYTEPLSLARLAMKASLAPKLVQEILPPRTHQTLFAAEKIDIIVPEMLRGQEPWA